MKQQKILFVTNIITPYLISLFNYITEHADFEFKVISLSENEANREWKITQKNIRFTSDVLSGWHWFMWSRELPIHINWGIWKYFIKENPDIVIVSGWSCLAYWEIFLYCKLFKKKYILWSGTTLLSVGKITGLFAWMKQVMVKGSDCCIAYGSKAAEYLEYMGAAKNKIHVGINTVDMDWFRRRVAEARNRESFSRSRSKYPKLLILYVGQLIDRKGIKQVLKALQELKDPDIGFLIVGGGPQEEELKDFCQKQNLHNVYFEGFRQQEDLPYYYALADVFVLPAFKEVWGLVINEALASGLYVLCSSRAGVAYDLITNGENGELFDPDNIDEIVSLIRRARVQIHDIRAKRTYISEHACQEFDISRAGEVFLNVIDSLKNR